MIVALRKYQRGYFCAVSAGGISSAGVDVSLQADNLSGQGPSIATISMTFNTDGSITINFGDTNVGSVPLNIKWFSAPPGSTNRWVKATNSLGTPSTGTVGSALQLSSSRAWTVQSPVLGTKTWVGTFQMYSDAGVTTVGPAVNISFSAQGV